MGVVKARAPCRISLAGGGSDFPEFFNENGGAVLNFAINLYSYASLSKTNRKTTRIISHDWDIDREITDLKIEFEKNKNNNVDIVKATMKDAGLNPQDGYKLTVHSEAQKNSGLAGSSSLVCSLMEAMQNQAGKSFVDRHNMAENAYYIERTMLKRAGGKQDSYIGIFGGVSFFEFSMHDTKVYPLRLENELLCEMHSSMLLFDTPCKRTVTASSIEAKKIENMQDNIEHLKGIRDIAYEMKKELMHGNVEEIGHLLDSSWQLKREIDGVSNCEINNLIQAGKSAGALGMKLCGAGQGGFLFAICDLADRKNVIKSMARKGCSNVNFDFDQIGAISWRT